MIEKREYQIAKSAAEEFLQGIDGVELTQEELRIILERIILGASRLIEKEKNEKKN